MKKVICVTGGSSGFGYEVSKLLAIKGHIVYAGARTIEKMESLKAYGVHILELNVTLDDSVKAFVDHVIKREDHIDVLINNAGYGAYGVSETQSLRSIQAMYDVNVYGVIRMNQQVIPYMRVKRQGRIIQIASLVSHVSIPGISHYAATKHALRSMTESLRSEIRPFGIDVVQIEPGAVNTGFEEVALGLIEPTHEDYQSFLSAFKIFIKKVIEKDLHQTQRLKQW
jgi:short-subunit dehydrogenase